jgi:hypothetical protein
MDVPQFTRELQRLLRTAVDELTPERRAELIRRQLELYEHDGALLAHRVELVPFVPGRRPADELLAPGLGSSEAIGLLAGAAPDTMTILYRLSHTGQPLTAPPAGARLIATLSLIDDQGRILRAVPGWQGREIASERLGDGEPATFALRIDVDDAFGGLRDAADPTAPFGFASLFFERVRLDLALELDGAVMASDTLDVEVFDESAFGSLYARVATRLLPADLRRQVGDRSEIGVAYHPWFPVLCIGVEKANLYMKAVRGDIVRERRMLTDPAWLLRVGLYLELLTCLGIAEACRDAVDLLTAGERAQLTRAPRLREVMSRLDVAAWTGVWELREIATLRTPGLDMPVGFQNLLRKKAATLAFLHAHHADLQHAIALAGDNRVNAQETWQRVFRDAERAVLTMNQQAFPELAALPAALRGFILWHRKGNALGLSLPKLSGLFGDQDGLYLSACTQYRASMNAVAAWAAERGHMEFTGDECVPRAVSLLESHLAGNLTRLAQLQRRDGYAAGLELRELDEEPRALPVAEIRARLVGVPLFAVLTGDELDQLARMARPISLGPTERIIVQGNPGSSLFLLHEGALEVIARTDGQERVLAELSPGAVVGEVAFLTGAPRSASVRAIDAATVIEIAARHLEPIARARPAVVEQLGALMTRRRELALADAPVATLRQRIAAAILGE